MLLHADADRYYPLAVIVSLLLHAALVGVGMVRWAGEPERRLVVPVDYVRATLIELEERAPRVEPPKPDVLPQRNIELERQQALEEQKRLAEQKAAEQKAADEKAAEQKRLADQRAAEAKRLAEQKLAEERAAELKRLEELERLEQLRRQEELARRLQEEQQAAASVSAEQAVMSVANAIGDRVERSWSRPPSARNGMTAIIRVTLVPTGSVVSAEIVQSSGDEAFDRSALQAVGKAEPFEFLQEVPIATFEQRFRHFQFEFSPQDLRL